MAYDRGKLEALALELENDGDLHREFGRLEKADATPITYRSAIERALRSYWMKDGGKRPTFKSERAVLHRHLAWKWGVLDANLSVLESGDIDLYPGSHYDCKPPSTCPDPSAEPSPPEIRRASDIAKVSWRRYQTVAEDLERYYKGWAAVPPHTRLDVVAQELLERTGCDDPLAARLVLRHLDGIYKPKVASYVPPRDDLVIDVDLFQPGDYGHPDWHSGSWYSGTGERLYSSVTGRMSGGNVNLQQLPKGSLQVDRVIRPGPELVNTEIQISASIDTTGMAADELKSMQTQIAGHLQQAASHFARVDAALAQTTGKTQTQTSPELGNQTESIMTKAITITTVTVKSTDPKENRVTTYVNGSEIKELTTSSIYALISDSESLIETLSKIKNKPLHLQAEIDAHKAGIDALVKHLDERYLAENPGAVVAKPAAKRRNPGLVSRTTETAPQAPAGE